MAEVELGKEFEKTARLYRMPAPYNPREIEEHDFDALKESLTRHGLVQPIVVNLRSPQQGWEPDCESVIVGGHQRVKAAADLGWEEMWIERVDWDERDERNANLALNRISGDWERDMLERALRELKAIGDDLTGTGFTEDEITRMFDEISREPPAEFPNADEKTTHECPKCGYKWKAA